MSKGDAELPLAVSGEQIRQREFATVRRGYDPAQVRSYLASVAVHLEGVERELIDARARVVQLDAAPTAAHPEATSSGDEPLEALPTAPETDPYERLTKRFVGTLATADAEADRIVDDARDEAVRIKAEAQARAEALRSSSARSLIAAQEESDRMLATLAQRREAMLGQLHDMQSRLLSVAEDLEVAFEPAATDTGLAGLFDDPAGEGIQMPDLSGLDLELGFDDGRESAR